MNFKEAIIKATSELNEIEENIDYFKTSNATQSGLAYVFLSNLMDDLLLEFGKSLSVENRRKYHSVVGDLLYEALKILRQLNVFCRYNADAVSDVGSLYSFAKNEAASYIELYALTCTKRNKYIVLEYIQKKSRQECQSLRNYYINQLSQHSNARSRDAIYQIMRLNLSSKIYLLSIFRFIKNIQSELVNDMARYLPFTQKFGYREKYFPNEKLFLHSSPINASVLGIVDSKNSSLVSPKSSVNLKLCEVSKEILHKLDGKNVIATGYYDGKQSMVLSGYSKVGAYGWLAEFFGISSGLDPSPFYSGNPKIEII